jgi:membrane protease YdiL (CAAX protease family)
MITEGEPSIQTTRPLTAVGLAVVFLAFLADSAIQEEAVFRGFLWGYLETLGLKQPMIWLLQAGLFWIAHLRYLDRPFTFWLALPASGLLLGWLSWKSKSISASVLAHAAYNSMASYF